MMKKKYDEEMHKLKIKTHWREERVVSLSNLVSLKRVSLEIQNGHVDSCIENKGKQATIIVHVFLGLSNSLVQH